MLRIGIRNRGFVRLATVVAALALSACSALYPSMDQGPVADQPDIVVEPAPATVEATPMTRPPTPPSLPAVAIVMTSAQPAYAEVTRELVRHFKEYDIYDFSDVSRPPVSVLRLINDSNSSVVIAVGLRAAQSSVAMAEVPVVFSQVFNHQDYDLLRENSRGVSALAPLDAQIAAWKNIDPSLTRIGAIVGEGHDDLIAEAKIAAQRSDVELRIDIAHSDQETLYFFRHMIRDIDGYWLLPDNRILSGRVLRQMLGDANRQSVPVAVPQESMLEMGASISMSTDAADIARTIVDIVRKIQAGHLDRVPPITRLSEIRVATNDELLKKQVVARSSTPGFARTTER